MRILGIESSCDETAAAVVEDGRNMLSNVVASSVDLHKIYGGVVPEIAARSHLEVINPVIDEALTQAGCTWEDIDAIAVTYGPGLGGSLLVGVMTARTLAIQLNKPLYAINHVQAHTYASFITSTDLPGYQMPLAAPALPLISLIVSGGHSQLVLVKDHNNYEVLGRTQDDAVGEAFDKVAKILGLPYPGGPSISAAAKEGNPLAIKLPKAKMSSPYDFSFSGLKTAVLRASQAAVGKDFTFPSSGLPALLSASDKANIAASFQYVAIETLVDALERAINTYQPASVVVGGGVAANSELRDQISKRIKTPAHYADIKLCTDNATMIASLAYFILDQSTPVNPYKLEISPSLAM
jgi:N6-L-threonylcarbamoyladenine synthase